MSVSRLVMAFTGTDGDASFSYNYAKPNASTADIKTLVTGMITNGDIFANPAVAAKSAKIVTTSETVIDLSD